jgi:alkyl sulfatase BDS1-like metallo-beta-lactamase superfamily hydrolase
MQVGMLQRLRDLPASTFPDVFNCLGTRVDRSRAGKANIVINRQFTDTHEPLASTLDNGAWTSINGKTDSNVAATVTTTRAVQSPQR